MGNTQTSDNNSDTVNNSQDGSTNNSGQKTCGDILMNQFCHACCTICTKICCQAIFGG